MVQPRLAERKVVSKVMDRLDNSTLQQNRAYNIGFSVNEGTGNEEYFDMLKFLISEFSLNNDTDVSNLKYEEIFVSGNTGNQALQTSKIISVVLSEVQATKLRSLTFPYISIVEPDIKVQVYWGETPSNDDDKLIVAHNTPSSDRKEDFLNIFTNLWDSNRQSSKSVSSDSENEDLDVSIVANDTPVSTLGFSSSPDNWAHERLPPWNLCRISKEKFDNPLEYIPYGGTYSYPITEPSKVLVFVIDSGVNKTHSELQDRVIYEESLVATEPETEDFFGHGTFVSSIITGKMAGVAKNVQLGSIKVIDRDGLADVKTIISAFNRVVQLKNSTFKDYSILVNLSINADGVSNTLLSAIASANEQGILTVISAGNNSDDACSYSPSGEPSSITVGAIGFPNDAFFSYSNYGKCVDILAPGQSVLGASDETISVLSFQSGTSMAAPMVTGVCAQVWQNNPSLSPAEVRKRVLDSALRGLITDLDENTPNLLLWNGYSGPTLLPEMITDS
ncbi:Subtilase-type proteinase psp3 [Zancudomyces culisetae]|uniref:Subtilase-type proteinase psp3 n=1 Tax=Zancudomyces culisetae TaxID=1213189 RepID=A0A1R1PJD3_ZANCU|nr:Subtilase-type proteinase psp3 [Zancudomyces culisetae]|eukprot:OMH81066.1 Subtilase-type proteinase psp3 [Zancudomyces culisetae]